MEESKDGYGYGAEEFEDVDELREPADEGCASPVGRGGRIAAARPASEDSHRPGKAKARSGSGSTIGSNSTRDTNDFAVVDLPDPYAAKSSCPPALSLPACGGRPPLPGRPLTMRFAVSLSVLADDAAALRRWLFANHFDEVRTRTRAHRSTAQNSPSIASAGLTTGCHSLRCAQSVASTLSSYGVADVLALSKTDLKDLLGVSVGLRLFSRIAQQKALVEGGGGVPGVGVGAFGPSSAPSVRGRAPSRYGQCNQRDCGHPSVSVCSVAECGASVCVWHEAKSLLTSHVYCPLCERDTFEGRVRAAVANAAVSADAAATRIIDRTAEWTHSGRDAIAAHSLDSHEPPSVSEHGLPLPPSHGYQHTTAAFADEEKQPPQPRSGGSGGSVNGAGGARLPFVSDWLRGDEDGEEVEEEAHYRETSWNERAQAQCALQ